MKRILAWTLGAVLALVTLSFITDNGHIWKGLRECYLRGYRSTQIDDLPFQSTRTISASPSPKVWPKHRRFTDRLPAAVQDSTHAQGTVAIALIHRDSLLLDWTSHRIEGADTMRTNAFSIAKTFTALAIGAAVTDGLLSVDDPVSKFLPRFDDDGPGAELTVKHLLQMRSGIPFGENYKNPVGFMARSTYGRDILDRTAQYAVEGAAGTPWKYQGGNTLVLQDILLHLIDEPLGSWFERRIWHPLGCAEDAAWAVDNRGHERNYCCFFSRAKEYARLGQFLLDSGQVNGEQLIDRRFMTELMSPVGPLANSSNIQHYGYQVWMGQHAGHNFTAYVGLHGQYILAVHDLDLVAVRTGFRRPKGKVRHLDVDLYSTLDLAFALVEST